MMRATATVLSLLALLVVGALGTKAQHGDDVACSKMCLPADISVPLPEEVETYECAGACTHGETDPCAEGKEAKNCGEYCRKHCCKCREAHCP